MDNQLPNPTITPQQPSLQPSTPNQPQTNPNSKIIIVALTGFFLIILLVLVIYINKQHTKVLTLPAQIDNSQKTYPTPTPPVTDTAPNLPSNQKTQILIHHSDSTFEILLVPTQNVNMYTQNLPAGETVIKTTPLK